MTLEDHCSLAVNDKRRRANRKWGRCKARRQLSSARWLVLLEPAQRRMLLIAKAISTHCCVLLATAAAPVLDLDGGLLAALT